MVRQWITCAGHAGVFTAAANHWLHFEVFLNEQYRVRAETTVPDGLRRLLRDRHAREEDIPRVLRWLTLRQTTVFKNEEGAFLRIRVSPHRRRFEIVACDGDE